MSEYDGTNPSLECLHPDTRAFLLDLTRRMHQPETKAVDLADDLVHLLGATTIEEAFAVALLLMAPHYDVTFLFDRREAA
jgi:hypothetical protein